jgi:hypothetical protein
METEGPLPYFQHPSTASHLFQMIPFNIILLFWWSLSILSCNLLLDFPSCRCTNLLQQVARTNTFSMVASNVEGSSTWNVFLVTLVVNTILKQSLDFWKICAPLSQITRFPLVFRLKLLPFICELSPMYYFILSLSRPPWITRPVSSSEYSCIFTFRWPLNNALTMKLPLARGKQIEKFIICAKI